MKKITILIIIFSIIFIEAVFFFAFQNNEETDSDKSYLAQKKTPSHNNPDDDKEEDIQNIQNKNTNENSHQKSENASQCLMKIPYSVTRTDNKQCSCFRIQIQNLDKDYGGIFIVEFKKPEGEIIKQTEKYIDTREKISFNISVSGDESYFYNIHPPKKPC